MKNTPLQMVPSTLCRRAWKDYYYLSLHDALEKAARDNAKTLKRVRAVLKDVYPDLNHETKPMRAGHIRALQVIGRLLWRTKV